MSRTKFRSTQHFDGSIGTTQLADSAVTAGKADLTSATWTFGTDKAQCAAAPTTDYALANKAYVDAVAAGMGPYKEAARAATTEALPACTYNNGTSGVGATLTADANGVLPATDGVTLVANDRLLVKNQAAGLQNGIYAVTDVGSAGTPWILTRTIDADQNAEVSPGMYLFVTEGTLKADTGWVCSTDGTITIGTTAITWVQFSTAGVLTAGDGIQITSGAIGVKPYAGDLSFTISASGIKLNAYANGGVEVHATNGVQLKLVDTSLATGASGVQVNLASNPGLEVSSGLKLDLDATTAASSGLELNANGVRAKLSDTSLAYAAADAGIKVNLAAAPGLEVSSGLKVLLDPSEPGLQLTSGLKVLLNATASGLELSTGLRVDCKDTSLAIDASGLAVNLASNPGLEVSSGLKLDLDATTAASSGMELNANGVRVKLADSSMAYAATDAGIGVKLDTAGAIGLDAGSAGLEVKVDGSSIEISSNALQVKAGGITSGMLAANAVLWGGLATATQDRIGRWDRREDKVDWSGATAEWTLSQADVDTAEGGHQVFYEGQLLKSGAGNDYTIASNVITFLFNPVASSRTTCCYKRTGSAQ